MIFPLRRKLLIRLAAFYFSQVKYRKFRALNEGSSHPAGAQTSFAALEFPAMSESLS
jgi:hypothetical protein